MNRKDRQKVAASAKGAIVKVEARSELDARNAPDAGEPLNTRQRAALELLLSGKTFVESAERVGVARMTVFRWLKNCAEFRAAYNEWLEEQEENGRARLAALTAKATAAIERQLERGDGRLALRMLERMGVASASNERRLTDVEDVRTDAELKRREDKAELVVRELDMEGKLSREKLCVREFSDECEKVEGKVEEKGDVREVREIKRVGGKDVVRLFRDRRKGLAWTPTNTLIGMANAGRAFEDQKGGEHV